MKELQLLVVDDDDLIIQAIRMALPNSWYLIGVNSAGEVSDKKYHAAFIDMHLSGNKDKAEGLQLIKSLHEKDPFLEIVAISGDSDRELMEKGLRAGATRFLSKPLNIDEFLLTLSKIEALILLQGATTRSQKHIAQWIGSSAPSAGIKRAIASLKGESGPILIEGESGTGKEVTVNLIHNQEDRGPLICVNMAALPENLFESEFFGHVRGAFTGAEQNKMGLAEAAHDGDLFLDEVEALSLPHQAKLLRFLETGEIRRLGSKESVLVRTRVLAATNQNLENLVREGRFREDLLWRLNGKKIVLPPLRERLEDLEELIQYFLSLDSSRKKTISTDALEVMGNYSWPGNIRELKRVCEQLLITAPLPIIRAEDIKPILHPNKIQVIGDSIDYNRGLTDLLNDFEARVIAKCLEDVKDIDEASRMLGISRSSLYKKIKDHEIQWRPS